MAGRGTGMLTIGALNRTGLVTRFTFSEMTGMVSFVMTHDIRAGKLAFGRLDSRLHTAFDPNDGSSTRTRNGHFLGTFFARARMTKGFTATV
jgi:hypothetical protein